MENGKRWLLLAAGTAVYALGIDLGCHAGFGGTTLSTLWNGLCLLLRIKKQYRFRRNRNEKIIQFCVGARDAYDVCGSGSGGGTL